MSFVHGKNVRLFVDAFDLSQYFNDVSISGKVEQADTTTYAKTAGVAVAKTILPGVRDGTMSLKGLFDGTVETLGTSTASTVGSDLYWYNLLANETGVGTVLTPSNVEACVSVSPTGTWAVGTRIYAMAGVVSNYTISAPVKNAVSVQADFQADGGVLSGVSLHDPSVSDTIPATVNVAGAISLPTATLTVSASTAGYNATGSILVPVSGGYTTITYTGVSGSTFTGCTGGVGPTVAGAVLQLIPGTGANDEGTSQGSTITAAYGTTPVNGTTLVVPAPGTSFTFQTTATVAGTFPASGQFLVPTSTTPITVSYTGLLTAGPFGFSGCTSSASGTATASTNVTFPPIVSNKGAYGFLHVSYVAGTSAGIAYAKIQHSDDNSTWTDVSGAVWGLTNMLGQFASGQADATANGPGGYILYVPQGVTIQRYVRVVLAYLTASTSASVLCTWVRF